MGQYTARELQPQMKMYTCPFVLEYITDRRADKYHPTSDQILYI